MADDEVKKRKIKIRPDGNAIAIETDFPDDPDTDVQSFHFIDGTRVGFKTAAQVADWTDG